MADEPRTHLFIRVDDLAVPIAARNRLRDAGIIHVGDLVQKTEKELLYIRSFGKASVGRIKAVLSGLGLKLGMTIHDWP